MSSIPPVRPLATISPSSVILTFISRGGQCLCNAGSGNWWLVYSLLVFPTEVGQALPLSRAVTRL